MYKITHHNFLKKDTEELAATSKENAVEQGRLLAKSLGWIDYTIADKNGQLLYESPAHIIKQVWLRGY